LYSATIANRCGAGNVYILTKHAVGSNSSARHYVAKVPNHCISTDCDWMFDDGARVYGYILGNRHGDE